MALERLRILTEGGHGDTMPDITLPTAVLDQLLGMSKDIGEIKGGILAGAAENKRLADYQAVQNGEVAKICQRVEALEGTGQQQHGAAELVKTVLPWIIAIASLATIIVTR